MPVVSPTTLFREARLDDSIEDIGFEFAPLVLNWDGKEYIKIQRLVDRWHAQVIYIHVFIRILPGHLTFWYNGIQELYPLPPHRGHDLLFLLWAWMFNNQSCIQGDWPHNAHWRISFAGALQNIYIFGGDWNAPLGYIANFWMWYAAFGRALGANFWLIWSDLIRVPRGINSFL